MNLVYSTGCIAIVEISMTYETQHGRLMILHGVICIPDKRVSPNMTHFINVDSYSSTYAPPLLLSKA